MPTYEFRCPNGHVFDRFFGKISDAPGEVPCPECGATAERQISGGAGLLFKGSGFYLTDYGKNAHRGSAPKSDTSGAGSKSSGDGKSGGESAAKSGDSASTSSAGKSEAKSDKSSTSGGATKDSGTKPSGGSTT